MLLVIQLLVHTKQVKRCPLGPESQDSCCKQAFKSHESLLYIGCSRERFFLGGGRDVFKKWLPCQVLAARLGQLCKLLFVTPADLPAET